MLNGNYRLAEYAWGPAAQQFAASLTGDDATTGELRRWIQVSAEVLMIQPMLARSAPAIGLSWA